MRHGPPPMRWRRSPRSSMHRCCTRCRAGRGPLLLADGDARGAVDALRRAREGWDALRAPYEAARARVLLGSACQLLGDLDTGRMEMEAAREGLRRGRGWPDLARLDELSQRRHPDPEGQLTTRELDVIRLVATGRTNRQIADALVISEKTVARHLSNISPSWGWRTGRRRPPTPTSTTCCRRSTQNDPFPRVAHVGSFSGRGGARRPPTVGIDGPLMSKEHTMARHTRRRRSRRRSRSVPAGTASRPASTSTSRRSTSATANRSCAVPA